MLLVLCLYVFFFQAEDGIRDAQESRGLGDVYKRQPRYDVRSVAQNDACGIGIRAVGDDLEPGCSGYELSLIHI